MITAKAKEAELGDYVKKASEYVSVTGTRFVDKSYFEVLKNMETDKIKEYRCVVWTKRALSNEDMAKLNGYENLKVKYWYTLNVGISKDTDTRFA